MTSSVQPVGPQSSNQQVPRLRVEHVSKTFKTMRALDDVNFSVQPGELHGLVGQNGCGKSTLMKILTGLYVPDPGAHLSMDGDDLQLPLRLGDLDQRGIHVVHQHLGLIHGFSVLENMRVSRYGAGRFSRRIRWSREREQAAAVFERLGQSVDLDATVGSLPAEVRATVGIARALQDYQPGRGVILLDESTRALTRGSLNNFYKLLDTLTDEGAAIVLVSHRLEEVLEVCGRVTVLRDGRVAGSGLPTAELDEPQLVRLMLGYEQQAHAARRRAPATSTEVVAQIENLKGGAVEQFGVKLGRGEIVGVTGLAGSGFEQIPYLAAAAQDAVSGVLKLGETEINLARREGSVSRLIDAGVFLVPEKRDEEGLVLELGVADNITLPRVSEKGKPWRTGGAWQEAEAKDMIKRLGIKTSHPRALVSTLSGGNQQKVLLGKWLAGSPRLLLLHEPTQAVDVGARRDIIEVLRAESDRGCAILVSATDVGDLSLICDRVLIMRDGIVVQELTGDLDPDQIVEATFTPTVAAGVGTDVSQ